MLCAILSGANEQDDFRVAQGTSPRRRAQAWPVLRRGLERCWTTFTVKEQRRAAEQQVKSVLSSRYRNDKEEAYVTHTPDKDAAYVTFWEEAWT